MPLETTLCNFILFVVHNSAELYNILDLNPLGDALKIQPLRKYTVKNSMGFTVISEVMEIFFPLWKDDLMLFDHRVANA